MSLDVEGWRETLGPAWVPSARALADLETLAASFVARSQQTIVRVADAPGHADGTESLRIGETLGEGGMGIVRAADQLVLARGVAIKTVHPERGTAASAGQLVREALVTGLLEHPNVVPVHDLRFDERGQPLVVLKRIRGTSWEALLRDPARVRDRFFERDPLAWHLRVLIQVCRAVELAHEKGIVHRDLKPANVMLGEHDEVYVVDWGVAAAFRDDVDPRLPRVDAHVVGTPAYLAPEMVRGAPEAIDERTDVYLLGAVLYELLVGHPPHRGAHFAQILFRVLASEITWPEDLEIPDALRALADHALARDPAARPPSATAFRRALEDHLEHRASIALAREAEEQLRVLETAPDRDARQRAFGQCRFAFQHAMRIWPDNEAARRGLDRALAGMATHELDEGHPRAAADLLAEAAEAPAELAARIDEALERERRDREVLEALEHERSQMDPRVGRTQRIVFALCAAVTWLAGPIVLLIRKYAEVPQTPRELVVWPLIILVGFTIPALVLRRSLESSALNRRFVRVLLGTMLAMFLHHAGGVALGLSIAQIQALDLLLFAGGSLAVTVLVERRFAIAVVVYLVAFAVAAALPEERAWPTLVGSVVVVGTFLWLWPPWRAAAEERPLPSRVE
ncbi:MAG: serine/threonine protein kinase [Sandaracinaceae bacterium]|nr:serine/threonine protein kinase [Sandaracinaceae bacterium]